MNILFILLYRISDVRQRNIYNDLMRKFRDEGHQVHIVSSVERRFKEKTQIKEQDGIHLLQVKTLNVQKTNIVEKGLGTLLLEYQFHHAIHKYFSHVKFDLILYSTPPITLTSVIRSIRKRDKARTYLLLKDIFPQNAVDIGMLNRHGLLYRFFRLKEKKLYKCSDFIGCMSPANVRYLLAHNPSIPPQKVEVNPNSIELSGLNLSVNERNILRTKYQVPVSQTVFVYGGNLGKPQGIDFLMEVILDNVDNKKAFFLIVGSGTEYNRLNAWFKGNEPSNAMLIPGLPQEEYDRLVQTCDVGLIFLDRRFTIPNFPSRLLSYLENKMPVIAATDPNTDIGVIAEENGFGFRVVNGDKEGFKEAVLKLSNEKSPRMEMGENGYNYLCENYLVSNSYDKIMSHFPPEVFQPSIIEPPRAKLTIYQDQV